MKALTKERKKGGGGEELAFLLVPALPVRLLVGWGAVKHSQAARACKGGGGGAHGAHVEHSLGCEGGAKGNYKAEDKMIGKRG